MIRALLRIFDWHYHRGAATMQQPVLPADLAREFAVRPKDARQALTALGYQPVRFKSTYRGTYAYREWWFAPTAVIRRPTLGRPQGAVGIVKRLAFVYLVSAGTN
jgi:hypothetical protein